MDDLNYEAITAMLQAENEMLRERVSALINERIGPFGEIARWWKRQDSLSRYYLVAGACMIVTATVALASLFRRD